MNKKYIKHDDYRIYAIVYHKDGVIYYNLNFFGKTQLIIFK